MVLQVSQLPDRLVDTRWMARHVSGCWLPDWDHDSGSGDVHGALVQCADVAGDIDAVDVYSDCRHYQHCC